MTKKLSPLQGTTTSLKEFFYVVGIRRARRESRCKSRTLVQFGKLSYNFHVEWFNSTGGNASVSVTASTHGDSFGVVFQW